MRDLSLWTPALTYCSKKSNATTLFSYYWKSKVVTMVIGVFGAVTSKASFETQHQRSLC